MHAYLRVLWYQLQLMPTLDKTFITFIYDKTFIAPFFPTSNEPSDPILLCLPPDFL